MAPDMIQDGGVDVKNRTGVDGQLPDAQTGDFFENHIQHMVAVAQMVVKGDGHAVVQTGQTDGLPQGGNKLAVHCRSSLPIPNCRAMSRVCRARATMGASIIFPWRAMAPRPCSLARVMASMTSKA